MSDSNHRFQEKPNPIVAFAVDRKVTMGMCVLGVLVLGWLSLQRLPLEFLPSFSSSHISVMASYPSSSPEETERRIVRPLEEILGSVNGIDTLMASASSSSGSVTINFVDGTDMDLAAVEVRDRVDRVRDLLPDDLERVMIRRFQSTDIPVLRFRIAAPWDQHRLYVFVQDVLQRRLERLEGVASVDVRGLQELQVQVNIIPARLAAHGIDVRTVSSVLRANNLTLSGGTIREGSRSLMVRFLGELSSLDEIRRLPIGEQGLRVGDVAEVSLAYPDQDTFSYLNGSEALSVNIYKASNANLLAVVDRVKAELAEIRRLPEAAELGINVYADSSTDVRKGLAELRNAGLIGGALAIIFIFIFLRRFRTTLVAAIAIPVSVVVTFAIMYLSRQAGWTDLTLNIISLMGLMLAVGMLVDNAIVVIESVFRHRQDYGEDSRTAALRGASEVALPIFAATMTTVCVFLPMIFLATGRFASFMQQIGLTIVIVIVASLLVALTVVPMAAAHLLKRESTARHPGFDRFTELYGRTLRFTLRHRLAFSLGIVALLVFSWNLYASIERSFAPPSFERQIRLQVDTPRSYSLGQKHALYAQIYQLLDGHRGELEITDIAYAYRRGTARAHGWGGSNRFDIYLKDEKDSSLDTGTIRDRLTGLLPAMPGVTFTIGRSMRGHSGSGSGIELQLLGDRLEILEVLGGRVTAQLQQIHGVMSVDSSLQSGDEEIIVRPDRERALQAGLSSQAVGASVSAALSSRAASYFRTEDGELDVVSQYREQDRETLEQLQKLPVAFGHSPLPIGALAGFQQRTGARTIERQDRRAIITITGDTASGMPAFMVNTQVEQALAGLSLPTGYEWRFGSDWHDDQQEASDAIFVLLFALVLVYMIMAALFESFAHPFTIMFSVPFAFVGVGIVMFLAGEPRGRSSDMGLIILAGIVVNNAIVLIDHINNLRRGGLSRVEAIVVGSRHRLRPILMTAITTVVGLSPMVAPYVFPQIFGPVEGRAAFWAPVGLVILGGLATSTVFTVMVIPTIYSLIDDLTAFARRVVAEALR